MGVGSAQPWIEEYMSSDILWASIQLHAVQVQKRLAGTLSQACHLMPPDRTGRHPQGLGTQLHLRALDQCKAKHHLHFQRMTSWYSLAWHPWLSNQRTPHLKV